MHDQLATGRKLRVLTIVDSFSRFSPELEPRFYLPPQRRCRSRTKRPRCFGLLVALDHAGKTFCSVYKSGATGLASWSAVRARALVAVEQRNEHLSDILLMTGREALVHGQQKEVVFQGTSFGEFTPIH